MTRFQALESSVKNEASYCPICGRRHLPDPCNPRSLAAIDAANTRALNDEMDPDRTFIDFSREEGKRISEGFSMLNEDMEPR